MRSETPADTACSPREPIRDGIFAAGLHLLALALSRKRFRKLRRFVDMCRYDYHVPRRGFPQRPRWMGSGFRGVCRYCGTTIYLSSYLPERERKQWSALEPELIPMLGGKRFGRQRPAPYPFAVAAMIPMRVQHPAARAAGATATERERQD